MSQDKLREALENIDSAITRIDKKLGGVNPSSPVGFELCEIIKELRNLSALTAPAPVEGLSDINARIVAEAKQSLDFDDRHPKAMTEAAYSHIHKLLAVIARLLARQPEAGAKPCAYDSDGCCQTHPGGAASWCDKSL